MKHSFVHTASIAAAAIAVTASAWGLGTVAHNATGTLTAASAQQGPGGRNRFAEEEGKILLSLKPPLTDKQRADFKAMREQAAAEARARRASGATPNPDPEARRKMGEQRRAEFQAKLARILTPGQLKQFNTQLKAYMKANPFPQRRPN